MQDSSADGPRFILVGVDGSDTSLRAGAYAAGLARRQGARLVVLFVHRLPGAAAASPAAIAALHQASVEAAELVREGIETQSARLGLSIDLIERTGNPFDEIIRLAKQLPADAVVVGASMQAGHKLIGSLAVHLVRAAKWPITVVP